MATATIGNTTGNLTMEQFAALALYAAEGSSFFQSLENKLVKYGSLTPNMIACVDREMTKRSVMTGRPVRESRAKDLTVGLYEVNGIVFLVKQRKDKTGLYAMQQTFIGGNRLAANGETVKFEFSYAKGMIHEINPEHRLSVERAEALSLQYGRCLMCGLELSDAKSVKAGMGPVCRKKQGAK